MTTWNDIDFVNDQLCNNEVCSDEELRGLFVEQTTLTPETIDSYIAMRDEFLTGARNSV